jgi:MoaA/NifB/PqqE/SkfB family radical SAM enzyme
MLWVSVDGANPQSYADVRLGAELSQVLENLERFKRVCFPPDRSRTRLGTAFVAMKRNIAELPAVWQLAQKLGASQFMVTNVLPYTKEMCDQALYTGPTVEPPPISSSLNIDAPCYEDVDFYALLAHLEKPGISLPRLQINEATRGPLTSLLFRDSGIISVIGRPSRAGNRCPFIVSGAGAVTWDGGLSPCLPLMHGHVSFLGGVERCSERWLIGDVTEKSLVELWNSPQHIAFRQRVQTFDFSPCITCAGCDLLADNKKDCFGNEFPTCGGCLWAQGLIQCP